MARISGVTLPKDKRVEIGLKYLYGVGLTLSKVVLKNTGIDPNTRVRDLSEAQVQNIREELERLGIKIEGELRREVLANIKRLKDIGSYRGNRHMRHLPVRGQRTKTNNRTNRGNVRKTAGSGRKSSDQKT